MGCWRAGEPENGAEQMDIIDRAMEEGRSALSEYESKLVLASYGVPVTRERLVSDVQDLNTVLGEIGYPVVLKACSWEVTHKTEKGLVRSDIRNSDEARAAFEEIIKGLGGSDGAILVQEMLKGKRELVVGLTRDPQFGPCVMFGLGGIFTEVLEDITFRVAPLEETDALEMMEEIRGHRILEAARGMDAADRKMLADILIKVGQIAMENEKIKEIDINPVIVSGSKPVAADALIIL